VGVLLSEMPASPLYIDKICMNCILTREESDKMPKFSNQEVKKKKKK
jgi:hypothetical protein